MVFGVQLHFSWGNVLEPKCPCKRILILQLKIAWQISLHTKKKVKSLWSKGWKERQYRYVAFGPVYLVQTICEYQWTIFECSFLGKDDSYYFLVGHFPKVKQDGRGLKVVRNNNRQSRILLVSSNQFWLAIEFWLGYWVGFGFEYQ